MTRGKDESRNKSKDLLEIFELILKSNPTIRLKTSSSPEIKIWMIGSCREFLLIKISNLSSEGSNSFQAGVEVIDRF